MQINVLGMVPIIEPIVQYMYIEEVVTTHTTNLLMANFSVCAAQWITN